MEIWKDIEGFLGYKVSNLGNVKAPTRVWKCGNHGTVRIFSAKILKPVISRKGYATVNMRNEDGHHMIKIHRLVAKAFIENPSRKPQVNHINGIKTDNRVENLEWCTNQENSIHSYKMGLQVARKGGEQGQARLVLNTQTGIYYDCIQDAANTIGVGFKCYIKLYKKLTGYQKNDSSFILA